MKTDLKYDKYKDYLFYHRKGNSFFDEQFLHKYNINSYDKQWIFKFPNNYGASVVKHYGTYGFDDDLFELAMIKFKGDDWHIAYTELTDHNVVGYLNNEEVMEYLERIKNYE